MHRSCLVALVLLAACQKEQPEQVVTKPLEAKLYPTPPEAHHTPTPPPTSGWLKIQGERWKQAQIKPEKLHFAQAIAEKITRNRSRYESVSIFTGVPWTIIGAIHNMEGSLDFRTNLGQGDPLTAQSRHVPRGRPPIPPQPPFSWEYAAEDSIRFDHLDKETWTDIAQELQNIEAWNGTGYQKYHQSVPTQYLWSWTTIERPGKYIADGKWSSTAVSSQCGVVPILKSLP